MVLVISTLLLVSHLLLLPIIDSSEDGGGRTILAVGAHAGDMELTAGAVLIKHQKMGDRVVILHLSLGEGGNPQLSPDLYADQKRIEARAAADAIGAEVIFGPYSDGQIPDTEDVRLYVADVIRQVRPTHVITHWAYSIHKDHSLTHSIVNDAVLLASLEGVLTEHPRHRGIRGVYFAENWEDADSFEPYTYVDVSDEFDEWREAVSAYEFVGGDISPFPYLQYYEGLFRMRGAEARKQYSVSFNIGSLGKRQLLDSFP